MKEHKRWDWPSQHLVHVKVRLHWRAEHQDMDERVSVCVGVILSGLNHVLEERGTDEREGKFGMDFFYCNICNRLAYIANFRAQLSTSCLTVHFTEYF